VVRDRHDRRDEEALEDLRRPALDAALVVALGAAVVAAKRAFVHRRPPFH